MTSFLYNDIKSSYLLVDLSYLTFYRFYATKIWYSKQNDCDLKKKWLDNTFFMQKYKKLYCQKLFKISKKYKIQIKNIIFCKDCSRKNIWRRKLLQCYKKNRDSIYTDDWCEKIGTLFSYTNNEFINELSDVHNFKVIGINNLEGDDIISITKEFIIKKHCLEPHKIIIISNDHDLLQLIDKNTTIINMKGKILNEKSLGNKNKNVMYKCILGDKSDNISSIFPKCGKITTMKLMNDPKLLEKYFLKYENSKNKYLLNKKLIDLDNIPIELKNKCIQNLKKINI